MPRVQLEDTNEVEAISIAIWLRRARPGANQVSEESLTRLRGLLVTEFAELNTAPTLPPRSRRL
jgi:hypothetical protein